jgi:hypothetical protein
MDQLLIVGNEPHPPLLTVLIHDQRADSFVLTQLLVCLYCTLIMMINSLEYFDRQMSFVMKIGQCHVIPKYETQNVIHQSYS